MPELDLGKKPEKGLIEEMSNGTTDFGSDSWADDDKESILLYGLPKCGKTFAYCSIIDYAIKQNKKVFLLNTDGGVAKTFKQYFGDKYKEIAKQTKYYFCNDSNSIIKASKEIITLAKKGDWVFVDLINDSYEFAQTKFLDDISGGNPAKYIIDAQKDPKRFGLFEGSKWAYIKRLDQQVTELLTKQGEFNIVGVATAKDIEPEKKIAKITRHEYDAVGFKPGGHKELGYKFNTVVFVGGVEEKFFKVAGDRGTELTKVEPINYGRNFWEKFSEVKRK